MTNLEKYHHTISVLVKAYLNDTLFKGTCYGCAVGNLVADAMGCKVASPGSWSDGQKPAWQHVFTTASNTREQTINPHKYEGVSKEQLDSTGYTYEELARIEYAFETATKKGYWFRREHDKEKSLYKSLMAVVEVLADIHKLDKQEAEQSKLLFVK